jgi:hypothetical protein
VAGCWRKKSTIAQKGFNETDFTPLQNTIFEKDFIMEFVQFIKPPIS